MFLPIIKSNWYIFAPPAAITFIYLVRKFREYQFGWVRSTASLKGKLFIITGANTGLGYEATRALVARDATVIMACRSIKRAQEAIKQMRVTTSNGILIPIELDLSSFDSIKEFVRIILADHPNFYCLINNAGLAHPPTDYTVENFEMTFGTNYLGPFLLTNLLLDKICENKARIVNVSSIAHQRGIIDFDYLAQKNPNYPTKKHFLDPYYSDSKLGNFYFTRELYKKGFDAHTLCPGFCGSDFFRNFNTRWYHYVLISPFIFWKLKSTEQGAQNIVHCATDNKNSPDKNPASGYYISDMKMTKSRVTFTEEISERLWKESAKLCGIN